MYIAWDACYIFIAWDLHWYRLLSPTLMLVSPIQPETHPGIIYLAWDSCWYHLPSLRPMLDCPHSPSPLTTHTSWLPWYQPITDPIQVNNNQAVPSVTTATHKHTVRISYQQSTSIISSQQLCLLHPQSRRECMVSWTHEVNTESKHTEVWRWEEGG